MLDRSQAVDAAAALVAAAMRAGADAADVVVVANAAQSVEWRAGRLEDVSRAESSGIGLRAFVGKGSASASSSDLSPDALDALVARTIAMARHAPEDAYAGLADRERLTQAPFADFDTVDGANVSPETLRDAAQACESAALAVAGVAQSQGASASASRSVMALATSGGFAGASVGTHHGLSATALVGAEGAMQRDYAYHSARHRTDLESPEAVGRRAGERAVAKRDPVRLPSGPMPVVFDPRVATSLIGHFIGAITGSAIARETSFLKDALGTRVFRPGVTIIDDPHRMRGLRSRAFDAEGLPTQRSVLVDDGVLTQWIADAASARQIGIAPTGHAVRGLSGAPGAGPTNLHLGPGTRDPAALIADIANGFYVTELIGMGVNGLTGDYSRGAVGFAIVDGQIAHAVAEVTIAGNLRAMFAAAEPANDLVFRDATNAPTVRIDGMTLAGA